MKLGGGSVITSSAQIGDGVIVNADINAAAAIARSKLADISATQRVIGRNTAGAGADEEVTLSQLLDWIGSAAWGDILFRGTSGWQRLPAGTSGQFLKTNGAGADPAWATNTQAFTVIKKSADESRNTLTNTTVDSELVIPVAANRNYYYRFFVAFKSASATPDFKFDFEAPASPVANIAFHTGIGMQENGTTMTVVSGTTVDQVARSCLSASSGVGIAEIHGYFENGANAGNLSFAWAQVTSNGTDVTVLKGSYVEYFEITP